MFMNNTGIILSGNSEAFNRAAGEISKASAVSRNSSAEKLSAASGASIMLNIERVTPAL
ncbi:MAG: hypothetical protein IJT87_09155 [Ruminiclostridium sp.]|nr:hypothetical protein [Ruminiclostridium sp.]